MIGGEALPFVEKLKFFSKKQLLFLLHRIKENTDALTEPDRQTAKHLLSAAITQVSCLKETELMGYKKYLFIKRKPNNGKRESN